MNGSVWTAYDRDILLANWERPDAELAALLGRTEGAIRQARVRRWTPPEQRVHPQAGRDYKVDPRRPWTDEEYGFLAAHEGWPAADVAQELGRSLQSIYQKRHRLQHDVLPQLTAWTVEENEEIIRAGAFARIVVLKERLPGRTEEAIATQRRRLGVETAPSHMKRPDVIGARPLIAKSCTQCGRLLPAPWFVWMPNQRQWSPDCKKCRSARGVERRREDPDRWNAKRRDWARRSQAVTLPRADNAGQPWSDSDDEVLQDPDLSILQKALRLKRTFYAVQIQCTKRGYTSNRALGDPDHDLWRIDNPNATAA